MQTTFGTRKSLLARPDYCKPPSQASAWCIVGRISIDENDFIIPPLESIETKRTPEGRVTHELVQCNFVGNSSSVLIKRACIEAVGGYDLSL